MMSRVEETVTLVLSEGGCKKLGMMQDSLGCGSSQSHSEPVLLGCEHHKYFPAAPVGLGKRQEWAGYGSCPCAGLEGAGLWYFFSSPWKARASWS